MLRDPKDVAKAYHDQTPGDPEGMTLAMVIRARDREVIAEAKRVLQREVIVASGGGEGCEVLIYSDAIAALDAILKEKE